MKFFGWMQSKINGGQGHKNSRTTTSPTLNLMTQKEEFNDWPRGFLAIGTFGNNDLPRENEEIIQYTHENNNDNNNNENTTAASSSPDLSEFTPEEIGKLQKELTNLLTKKPAAINEQGETTTDLPLDRFLNCPSSLEVDRRLSTTALIANPDDKEEIDRTIRVILGRCKDIICKENNKKAVGKKSISFLLKKMFVCSSGLPPMPSLQDPIPESRMERLLRAMLKNKMKTRNYSRPSSAKKLTYDCQSARKGKGKATENDDEDANDGSKWVKTDSEYIVLEI